MPKLAANLSMLFTEREFLDRFALAAACGFRAVEMLFPYDFAPALIAKALASASLELVLFNTSPGDFQTGERGIAALPGREEEFRRKFHTSLEYAKALLCRRIHVMAGVVPTTLETASCRACFMENLRWASDRAGASNIDLLLEPLNPKDVPGYLLPGPAAAVAILDELRLGNLFLQYDVYHTQMSEGSLTSTFTAHAGIIRHIQISGVPGRNEPDENQEINYPYLLSLIDASGYDGWVGCEYRPRAGTRSGLGWAKPFGIAA
jgi:hydroxypyruvate isomerase